MGKGSRGNSRLGGASRDTYPDPFPLDLAAELLVAVACFAGMPT